MSCLVKDEHCDDVTKISEPNVCTKSPGLFVVRYIRTHTPLHIIFVVLKNLFSFSRKQKKSTPTNQGRGENIKGKTASVGGGVRGKRGVLERTLMVLIYIPGFLDVLLGSATLNKIYKRTLQLSDMQSTLGLGNSGGVTICNVS